MLGPVIAARDRWLKPGGVMIPRLVTAWTALVDDRYSGEMVQFLRPALAGERVVMWGAGPMGACRGWRPLRPTPASARATRGTWRGNGSSQA